MYPSNWNVEATRQSNPDRVWDPAQHVGVVVFCQVDGVAAASHDRRDRITVVLIGPNCSKMLAVPTSEDEIRRNQVEAKHLRVAERTVEMGGGGVGALFVPMLGHREKKV